MEEIFLNPGRNQKLNKNDGLYGWDNQFGAHESTVKEFKTSKYLASNYEFYQFY